MASITFMTSSISSTSLPRSGHNTSPISDPSAGLFLEPIIKNLKANNIKLYSTLASRTTN